ncbi:MAG: gliding motility-associated protein GldE [Flavobacteriales bacterium]|nr:gliding motility-associated protein GldE [Flavobacteriales bacterium]
MLVLLILSALVSGSEVAFFSLTPGQRKSLNDSGEKKNQRVIDLLENPDLETGSQSLLATILIANNFINIAIVLISTIVADGLLPSNLSDLEELVWNIGVITFLIVLFGEVIPKVYATSFNVQLATAMAPALFIVQRMVKPLGNVLIRSSKYLEGNRSQSATLNISVDQLGHALELTNDDERTDEEQKILEGIVNFGTKDAKQIMTSRVDMIAFSHDWDFSELIKNIQQAGYSRVPVYQNSMDEIAGILYIKDVIPHIDKEEFEWQSLIKSPFIVTENKKIDDLLKEFQERKIHLAIVVDEYGGTSGLVTMEDIIEEIVGEISDEFDDDDLTYSKLDDHNYIFEGKTPLIDLYRVMEIDGSRFEAAKGESDSLAGFVIEQSGKIPLKGEKIQFKEFTFTVEAADKRKIKRLKVTVNVKEDDE